MTPIISPWVFYLLGLSGPIIGVSGTIAIIFGILQNIIIIQLFVIHSVNLFLYPATESDTFLFRMRYANLQMCTRLFAVREEHWVMFVHRALCSL